jgi:pSer/pThr/pTyr-binding forkhead associated (FHA) protein
MFDQPSEHGHSGYTVEFDAPRPDDSDNEWLEDVREQLDEPGMYLAYLDEEPTVIELDPGWNRIGRSATADVRLDDPTVSRRHAQLVWEPGESLRVLDDRSLNGIFLNGELVEWAGLEDGDELAIGRYRLYLLEA